MSGAEVSDTIQEERAAYFDKNLRRVELFAKSAPALLKELLVEDGIDSQAVQETGRIVWEFMQTDTVRLAYVTAPESTIGRQPVNEGLVQTLGLELHEAHNNLSRQEDLHHLGGHISRITDAFQAAIDRGSDSRFHFLEPEQQKRLYSALVHANFRLDRIHERQRTIRSFIRIERAADEAEAHANAASQAAGITADAVISVHFQKMADTERDAANAFRLFTMVAMVIGGVIAVFYLLGPAVGFEKLDIKSDDYVHLLQRVLVVGAAFAFAAYTGRQAHNHRTLANWADSLSVQLQTFDAFSEAISNQDIKDKLRASFAERAFGTQPALRGESSPDSSEAIIAKISDLASKLTPGDK